MIRVTFSQAIVIEESKLADLLRAAGGNPATVEYLGDALPAVALEVVPVRRGRRPKSVGDALAPVQTGKKRGRKSNAEKAAMAAAEAAAAGGDAPADAPAVTEEAAPAVAEEAAPADPPADPVVDKKAEAAAKKAAAAEAKAAAAAAKKAAADAKKSADPAAAAAPADPAAADALLARFSVLIDKDFDSAKGILDGFGVKRFSELSADHYPDFTAKLESAGV